MCLLTTSNDLLIQHAGVVVHVVAQINNIIRSIPVTKITRASPSRLNLVLQDDSTIVYNLSLNLEDFLVSSLLNLS